MVKIPPILCADAVRMPFADQAFDLSITSPPYVDARLYLEDGKNLGISRKCEAWVLWMLDVVAELQRVTRGPVLIVAAGVTRKRNYQPACEGLMWEWWKRGGDCQLYRPCFWHRVGIPGSGGSDWLRADVEYVMCFKRPGALPWSDNTACGHPPKWAPGGEMSNRLSSGARVNQWGAVGGPGGMGAKNADGSLKDRQRPSHFQPGGNGGYRANGLEKPRYFNGNGAKQVTKRMNGGQDRVDEIYLPPVKANPGNLIRCIVGGGVMGHALSHENEAPFPVKLIEFFIKSFCPPGGIVFDGFGGSGSTAHAALNCGRRAVSTDLRMTQCRLMRRRLDDVIRNPHRPKNGRKRPRREEGELVLFPAGPP